jgi:hypothetical protein
MSEFVVAPWRHHDPPRGLADQRSRHEVNENGAHEKSEHFTSMQVLAYHRLAERRVHQ